MASGHSAPWRMVMSDLRSFCARPQQPCSERGGHGSRRGKDAGRPSLIFRYRSDTLLVNPGRLHAPLPLSVGSRANRMDTIAFWLAVVGYIAIWCGIFGPLAWLIRTVGRMLNKRAETMAFSACYVGAVLGIVGPLMVIAANNPSLRFAAGGILEAFHERCPADWCSQLLALIDHPK